MVVRAAITSLALVLAWLVSPATGQERDAAEVWAERTRNAIAAAAANQHSEALTLFRAAMLAAETLEQDDPRRATAMSNLGLQRLRGGDLEGSAELLRQALELRLRLLGEDHGRVAESYVNLAVWHESQGDYEAAELALSRALVIREKLFGPAHPESLAILDRQMLDAMADGRLNAALRFGNRAVATDPGDNPRAAADRRQRLAALLAQTDAKAEAEELLREAIELAPGGRIRIDLSRILLEQERFAEAKAVLGPSPVEQAQMQIIEAKQKIAADDLDTAIEQLDEMLESIAVGEASALRSDALFLRAVANQKSAKFDAALTDLDNLLKSEAERLFGVVQPIRPILEALVQTQQAAGMIEEAAETRSRLEELSR